MKNDFYEWCVSHTCHEDCKNRSDYCPIADKVRSLYGGCPGGDKCERVFYQNQNRIPIETDKTQKLKQSSDKRRGMHMHFGNLVITIDGDERILPEGLIAAAVKKHFPKEHHHTRVAEVHDKVRESVCPSCLGVIITTANEYPNYCVWCGQAIDWSNNKPNLQVDLKNIDLSALSVEEQQSLRRLLFKAQPKEREEE